jgi:hypothetical protein
MKESPFERRIRVEILADPGLPAKREAHEKRMALLQLRLENGHKLLYEDQYYYCDGLRWEYVASCPLCKDVFTLRRI